MSNTSQHDPQKGIGWRYFVFIGILLVMFGYLASGLVELQLMNSEEYKDKAQTVALSPVPRALSSSCGTCVRYQAEEPLLEAMDADVEGVYEVVGREEYTLLMENQ